MTSDEMSRAINAWPPDVPPMAIHLARVCADIVHRETMIVDETAGQFAALMRVNPKSVRRAISVLERQGVLVPIAHTSGGRAGTGCGCGF